MKFPLRLNPVSHAARLFWVLATLLAAHLRAAEAPKLVVPSTHGSLINSVITSADGRWALSGSKTREIKLWDTRAAKEMGTIDRATFTSGLIAL